MLKIEITARFRADGSLIPLEFRLESETVQVQNVGRQWQSEEGRHLLVMDFRGKTYHLFFQLRDLGWYLIQDIKGTPDLV